MNKNSVMDIMSKASKNSTAHAVATHHIEYVDIQGKKHTEVEVTVKPSKKGAMAGMAIGGAIGGPVGAIIGGTAGAIL